MNNFLANIDWGTQVQVIKYSDNTEGSQVELTLALVKKQKMN